jgi:FkbM family methyltransferase
VIGNKDALRYALRDIGALDAVIGLTPGRTACVQAGGSLGVWPKRLAKSFATVYTFEPAADSFAALCQNAPAPNIVKFQAALGERAGLVGLSRQRRDGKLNNHPGITHVAGSGTVPMLPIDALDLPVCDLIYLDIEGYEFYALLGAERTLRERRPVVAVEINKSIGYLGLSGADVRAFMGDVGYREVAQLGCDVVFMAEESC